MQGQFHRKRPNRSMLCNSFVSQRKVKPQQNVSKMFMPSDALVNFGHTGVQQGLKADRADMLTKLIAAEFEELLV
jgi:hypothetical protein